MTAVATPLSVTLRRDDVLHFLGYPEGHAPPERTARLLDELLPAARGLVAARGCWRRLDLAAAAEVGLEPVDAEALVVGLVTIGPAVEDLASRKLAGGHPVAGLILDAAGSAAAEEAADALGAAIVGGGAEAAGVGCRISPGYGAWKIESQTGLFGLLPHREVGVELLPSLLMVPRKSISFAMWLGADARLSGCARCELERCRYRRRDAGGERAG